jgi:hypothetical protein
MKVPAAAFASLALAACSFPVGDKAADAAARNLYQEIATGADISRDPNLDVSLQNPNTLWQLASARSMLPQGAPTKVDNQGYKFNTTVEGTRAELTHAYHYPTATIIADTVLWKAPGQGAQWKIIGFHFRPAGAPPREANPVTTEGTR